jgi:phage shock protein C
MKRLYKSRRDRIIDGVCGGIGEYLGVDPTIVRIIFLLLFLWAELGLYFTSPECLLFQLIQSIRKR